jgi:hypothetical protein
MEAVLLAAHLVSFREGVCAMKKLLPLVVVTMLLGTQVVRAEQGVDVSKQGTSQKAGSSLSALQEEERVLAQRHGAERVKMREQDLVNKPSAERRSKQWWELNARLHREHRAMVEKHADKAPKHVDKEKVLKAVDALEQQHDAERTALDDKLKRDGVNGKARQQEFSTLVAKQREERQQLHRKHFDTAK